MINFKDGCRALLRDGEFSRYRGTNDLIACGDWGVTRRRSLAARLTLTEAESWVNDLHRKQPHMDYRGVAFAEAVAVEKVKERGRGWLPLCAHHNKERRHKQRAITSSRNARGR